MWTSGPLRTGLEGDEAPGYTCKRKGRVAARWEGKEGKSGNLDTDGSLRRLVEPRDLSPGREGEVKPAATSPGTEKPKILMQEVQGRPGEREREHKSCLRQ